jgi:thioredoxin reductase (NADPH)
MRFIILASCLIFKALCAGPAPVVIVGGGIAALTAAVQVSQAGIQPVVVSGPTPGGIITQSHSVQNWPGENDISGSALADKLQKQAEARGVQFLTGNVVAVNFSEKPITLTIEDPFDNNKRQTLTAKSCIIATGAVPKLLGVPGEKENLFTHIFTCAPCDGLRFKDKTVAVIGGGDSALTEAHYLSNLAKKVILIIRKDQFKTTQAAKKEAVLACPNVEVLYETSVTAFKKNQNSLTLELGKKELVVDGAFLAIGSLPNTALFKGQLQLDQEGYIVVHNNQETSVPGVFAAGDVSDKYFRQAMTAAGDATKAALAACQIVSVQEQKQKSIVKEEIMEVTSLSMLTTAVSSSQKPTVVYFYSPQCGPCRAFRSIYAKWAEQFQEKASFAKLSSENSPACLTYYHIESVPTVLIFNPKGEEIYRADSRETLAQLPRFLK